MRLSVQQLPSGLASRARLPRGTPASRDDNAKQAAVSRLIQIWINRGHLIAKLDPLGLMQRPRPARARPRLFRPERGGPRHRILHRQPHAMPCRSAMKLRDILAQLEHIYAGTIGAEFAHVSNSDERLWLQDQFQSGRMLQQFTRRRAPQHPLAAHRGRRPGALPAHQVRRPEALLARRRRRADPAAGRSDPARRRRRASRKSSSAWRIAAG